MDNSKCIQYQRETLLIYLHHCSGYLNLLELILKSFYLSTKPGITYHPHISAPGSPKKKHLFYSPKLSLWIIIIVIAIIIYAKH